jgi:hypothetical protein
MQAVVVSLVCRLSGVPIQAQASLIAEPATVPRERILLFWRVASPGVKIAETADMLRPPDYATNHRQEMRAPVAASAWKSLRYKKSITQLNENDYYLQMTRIET